MGRKCGDPRAADCCVCSSASTREPSTDEEDAVKEEDNEERAEERIRLRGTAVESGSKRGLNASLSAKGHHVGRDSRSGLIRNKI